MAVAKTPAAPKRPRGRPKKEDTPKAIPTFVSQKDLADFLGIAPSAVVALVKDGVIKREAKGRVPFDVAVASYIAHQKNRVTAKVQPESSADRLRMRREEEIARKMAREDRELIDLDEALATVDEVTGIYLESLSGIPARITNLVRERQRIEAILDEERQRLSDGFAEKRRALRTGIEASEASDTDDA